MRRNRLPVFAHAAKAEFFSGPFIDVKAPYEWKPEKYSFLTPDTWKSYGKVYRATMPGHLSAPTRWAEGSTRLEFIIRDCEMSIQQDGVVLATSRLPGSIAERIGKVESLQDVHWGSGIYGRHGCESLTGAVSNP